MNSLFDRIRATALQLPEVEERDEPGGTSFFVAGTPFARFRHDHDGGGPIVCVRAADADWVSMNLAVDIDWALVDDRIARSWELVAPQALLEAGGR